MYDKLYMSLQPYIISLWPCGSGLSSSGSRGYYPPLAIHSGNLRGRSMHLRDYFSTPAMRELEDMTMQDLDRPLTWWRRVDLAFLSHLSGGEEVQSGDHLGDIASWA